MKSANRVLKSLIASMALATALFSSAAFAGRGPAPLRHVVVFRFAPQVSQAQIQNVVDQFRALKRQIPQIVSLESGINNSKEGLNKGFTHTFIATFRNEQDRDYYVDVAPAHQAFKALVGPLLDGGANGVFVVDYYADPVL